MSNWSDDFAHNNIDFLYTTDGSNLVVPRLGDKGMIDCRGFVEDVHNRRYVKITKSTPEQLLSTFLAYINDYLSAVVGRQFNGGAWYLNNEIWQSEKT